MWATAAGAGKWLSHAGVVIAPLTHCPNLGDLNSTYFDYIP